MAIPKREVRFRPPTPIEGMRISKATTKMDNRMFMGVVFLFSISLRHSKGREDVQ